MSGLFLYFNIKDGMITISEKFNSLGWVSITGAIIYGLFCASNPTPEVVVVIGPILYFFSAATFYLMLCILWKSYSLRHKTLFFLKFAVAWLTTTICANLLYSHLHQVSYQHAEFVIAMYYNNFLYYLPFLP